MYCKNCGAPIDDDARFCASCGAAFYEDSQKSEMSVPEIEIPEGDQKQKSSDALWAMIFGIISIGLGWVGGYYIPGVILGFIGLRRAEDYVKKYGDTCTKVKIGHCLSKAGIIYGFVGMALILAIVLFYILFFALYFIMIAYGMSGGF